MMKRARLLTLVLILALSAGAFGSRATEITGSDAKTILLELSSASGAQLAEIGLLGVEREKAHTVMCLALKTATVKPANGTGSSLERQDAAAFLFRLVSGDGESVPIDLGNGDADRIVGVTYGKQENKIWEYRVTLADADFNDAAAGVTVRMQAAGQGKLSNGISFRCGMDGVMQPMEQVATNGDMTITNYNPETVLASTSGELMPVKEGEAVLETANGNASDLTRVRVGKDKQIVSVQALQSVILIDGRPADSATVSVGAETSLKLLTPVDESVSTVYGSAVKKTVVRCATLEVRHGTGPSYAKLGVLLAGDVVEVVEEVSGTPWSKIRYGSSYGYVLSKCLE